MTKFLQTLVDGLSVGSLYALVALGYTMVYGVLQFINFAHGDIVMVGAWVSLLLATGLGYGMIGSEPSLWSALFVLAVAMAFCAVLGMTIERLAYRPLRHAPRLNVLITAIGVSLFLQNVGQFRLFFGTEPRPMPALLPDAVLFRAAGVDVHLLDVLILGITIALMTALDFLVFGSRIGLAMRAVSYDRRTASLLGVPVGRVVSFTFAVGSALAAAGGFLLACHPKYRNLQQPADTSWMMLGLKAFVAAVVGGIGNIRGAMVGGVLIGLLEFFGAAYLSPHLRDVYVFALLILVLLLRPSGLLGKPVLEKV